jgi:all-trans-retinol 13,14-reductase
VIQQSGGEVFTYTNVAEVLVKRNRAYGVQMTDGTEITAPVVISNAGVLNTFESLLPDQISRKNGLHKLVCKVKPSVGHLGVYIGIKESALQLGLPKTKVWIYPDTNHQQNLAAFAADHEAPFPALYISFPSAKDPSREQRCPNTATIEIALVL